jgi:hypothetical protein
VSAWKPAPAPTPIVDPVVAAFENARPLDESLSADEITAVEEALADPRPGISSQDLLERLRPKT